MYNRVVLMGRLVADPVHRTTPSGASVSNFTLAVDGNFNRETRKMDATYIDVVVWNRGDNKLADRCADYLHKASTTLVEGKLIKRSFEAKEGGKRYVTEVVADNVRFIGGKSEGEAPREQQSAPSAPGMLDFEDFGQQVEYQGDGLLF